MNILESINNKINAITTKMNNNEELTEAERRYYRQYKKFAKALKSIEQEQTLDSYDFSTMGIEEYINGLEEEINKTIHKTASKRLLLSYSGSLLRLQSLKGMDLSLFKEFIKDSYPYERVDVDLLIADLIRSDEYTRTTGNSNKGFIYQNRYTGEVTIDRPTIALALEVLNGDFTNYNKLTSLQEGEPDIPEHLKGAKPSALQRIIYYGKGRIGTPEERVFAGTKDVLEFVMVLDDLRKQKTEAKEPTPEVTEFIKDTILGHLDLPEKFASRSIKPTNISCEGYAPLSFFDGHGKYSPKKFREMLKDHKLHINSVLAEIRRDDLIGSTVLNRSENGFIGPNNELNLANISLAAEVVSGNYQNYNALVKYQETNDESLLATVPENLRSADIRHLSRIIYYGRGRIGNPDNHDLDRDFYDIQVLEALAKYQAYLLEQEKLKEEQEAKTTDQEGKKVNK